MQTKTNDRQPPLGRPGYRTRRQHSIAPPNELPEAPRARHVRTSSARRHCTVDAPWGSPITPAHCLVHHSKDRQHGSRCSSSQLPPGAKRQRNRAPTFPAASRVEVSTPHLAWPTSYQHLVLGRRWSHRPAMTGLGHVTPSADKWVTLASLVTVAHSCFSCDICQNLPPSHTHQACKCTTRCLSATHTVPQCTRTGRATQLPPL